MVEIISLYIPKGFEDDVLYIRRMAEANNRSFNGQLIFMLSEYIAEHRRYQDSKITDYEVQVIEKMVKDDPDIICKECSARHADIDGRGYLVHDYGCSNNKWGPIWNE